MLGLVALVSIAAEPPRAIGPLCHQGDGHGDSNHHERGDDRRTIELSQRALSLLPQSDLVSRSVVALNLGFAHWSSGHLAEA